jgi:hypothetical protein
MTEKTNKIKLPKYSSYLTDNDSSLLDSFCTQFDCSKAKALPLLLKFWSNNKGKVSNELASISSEDLSAKKYDDRLATIEDKLATISYDTELATIKERLATLENMLTTIANNELAGDNNDSMDIVLSDTLTNVELSVIDDTFLSVSIMDDTESITLSECPILPIKETEGQIVPKDDLPMVYDDIHSKEAEKDNSGIGTLKDAIDNVILPELAKGTKENEIAKLLQDKYLASVNGTSVNWQTSVVNRAIDSRNKGKV